MSMNELLGAIRGASDDKSALEAVNAVANGKTPSPVRAATNLFAPESEDTYTEEPDETETYDRDTISPKKEIPQEYGDNVDHDGTFDSTDSEELDDSYLDDDSVELSRPDTPNRDILNEAAPIDANATPSWLSAHSGDVAGGPALYGNEPSFDDDNSVPDGGENYIDDDEDYSIKSKKKFDASEIFSPFTKIFEKNPQLKRPVLFGAGGIAVALVLALFFGGSPASDTPKEPPIAQEEPQVDDQPSGQEVTLLPKAVSASCPPGGTSPTLSFSGKKEEAWICGRANGIDGAIMNISFAKTVIVKSITVMPGWNYVAPNGKDNWNEHRLVTQILWRIGGQQFVQKINPTRSGATLQLPGNGVATTVMSLTIQKTEAPSSVNVESVPGAGDGSEGGVLPPLVGGSNGAPNSDVDATTAIGSITITGTET